MTEITRLSFVKSAAAGAAGVTVVGSVLARKADADERPASAEPILAYVKDPRTGEITVMSGDREVTIHDRKLAAALSHAAA